MPDSWSPSHNWTRRGSPEEIICSVVSNGLHMVLCFSQIHFHCPCGFQGFPNCFPIISYDFASALLRFSHGFPTALLWQFFGFPMASLRPSRVFPMAFQYFPLASNAGWCGCLLLCCLLLGVRLGQPSALFNIHRMQEIMGRQMAPCLYLLLW